MAWESFNLDREAHDLVEEYVKYKDARNQAYKMRVTVTYGLERFWGEQWRLDGKSKAYWTATWKSFGKIMDLAGIKIPGTSEKANQNLEAIANDLWELPDRHRKISLSILTQLCDSIVWWTQRYKKRQGDDE